MVASSDTGAFTYATELNQAGVWQITASWNGNEQYEAAVSSPITVTVQTIDLTPTFAIAGLGLGVIALILALLGVYWALKKKTGAPPPPSPPTT